jgi:hypothetical protein
MLKKIKLVLSIIISLMVIIGVIILCVSISQYREQKAEEERRAYIQTLIDAEIIALGKNTSPKDENQEDNSSETGSNSGGDLNFDDIVSGSLNESTISSVFTNIMMHTASTFTATIDGETKTYRLIGLCDDGDKDAVQTILSSLTKVVITHDVMKYRKGESIEQIYLWDTNDKDIANMVNLRIVREGHCGTTYVGTSYTEQTNVKYSLQFVSASKGK